MGTGVSPRRIITGNLYDPCGIRTRVTAVKGRCLNPLTNGPYETPQAGLEPATLRLTAGCSAIELLRIIILAPSKLNTSESFYSLSSLEHFVNNFFILLVKPSIY